MRWILLLLLLLGLAAGEAPDTAARIAKLRDLVARKHPEVERFLNLHLQQHPDDPPALALLAEVVQERDPAAARKLYDRALSLDPRVPMGRSLIRRFRAEEVAPALAADDLVRLRELSPLFPEDDALQDRVFRRLLERGELGEAIATAKLVLAADPAHPLAGAIAIGGTAATDARRLELLPPLRPKIQALAAAQGARFGVLHLLDAVMAELAGDPAGAAAALDPLLQRQPDDRPARIQRARLRLAAGDAAGAIADADLLLARTPDDAAVLAARAQARAVAGDAAGAIADLDRALTLRPGATMQLARARLRLRLGERAGALADILATTTTASVIADTTALLDAADLAKELGDTDAERRVLERASQLGNPTATLRLRRLPIDPGRGRPTP